MSDVGNMLLGLSVLYGVFLLVVWSIGWLERHWDD